LKGKGGDERSQDQKEDDGVCDRKKIDPSGDKKKRTVAAIVAMGVKKLVSESLGPPPPPPLRGRL
jgi:hypothetical protein